MIDGTTVSYAICYPPECLSVGVTIRKTPALCSCLIMSANQGLSDLLQINKNGKILTFCGDTWPTFLIKVSKLISLVITQVDITHPLVRRKEKGSFPLCYSSPKSVISA